MVEWPRKLISEIARKRVVFVIGSGMSRQSKGARGETPPDWKTFLKDANKACPSGEQQDVSNAIDSGDLLHACEWLKKTYDDSWIEYLRKIFTQPKFQPARSHEIIARLDSRIVFTLNFDDIYERQVAITYQGDCAIKNFYDADVGEFLRGDGRYIVKVHGTLNAPQKLIFTQQEYSKARALSASFYNAFNSALMTNTFVFIGAGYQDPDVNLLLENQKFIFDEVHPHYFLSTDSMPKNMQKSLRDNRNLKTIIYDPVDNNYSGLEIALEQLLNLVDAQREVILETGNW